MRAVVHRRAGRRWPLGLSAAAALLAMQSLVEVHACVPDYRDLNHDSVHATYEPWPKLNITFDSAIFFYRNCSFDETVPGSARLDFPGLTYVDNVYFNGFFYPAYQSAPDSALIAFAYQQALPFRPDSLVPLKLGESVPTSIMFTPTGGHQFNARVLFFTRGSRLRTFEMGGGTMHFEVPKYPFLNGSVAVRFKLTFPATTCPLEDASQSLDDVQVAELFAPGDTAKEKGVALRMLCAADPPRAKMTLTDANDASNTGSELSPTADSDAQGVRVQLLREGREVQFGQSWQFDSPTGGTLLHEFTARYLRTSDALVPGIIKGQAVLTADYW